MLWGAQPKKARHAFGRRAVKQLRSLIALAPSYTLALVKRSRRPLRDGPFETAAQGGLGRPPGPVAVHNMDDEGLPLSPTKAFGCPGAHPRPGSSTRVDGALRSVGRGPARGRLARIAVGSMNRGQFWMN